MRKQGEGGHLPAKEPGLRRNPTCQHLDPGLLASRTMSDMFQVFNPPRPWCFVMAAKQIETPRKACSFAHDTGRVEFILSLVADKQVVFRMGLICMI